MRDGTSLRHGERSVMVSARNKTVGATNPCPAWPPEGRGKRNPFARARLGSRTVLNRFGTTVRSLPTTAKLPSPGSEQTLGAKDFPILRSQRILRRTVARILTAMTTEPVKPTLATQLGANRTITQPGAHANMAASASGMPISQVTLLGGFDFLDDRAWL